MTVLEVLGITSLCLYGLLGVAGIISFIVSFRNKANNDTTNVRIQQAFHLFLGLFIAARMIWFGLHSFTGRTVASFIMNRLGFVLFFTAFTIVLFYWAETYHKNYVTAQGFLPRLFKAFIITNAVLYVTEGLMVIIFLIIERQDYSQREGNPVYEASIMLEIFVNFVVSVVFGIYGLRLFITHGKAHDFEETSWKKTSEILRILVSTIIFSICFLIRVIAFLYRPITQKYMNDQLFQVLAYYIPELIPSLVQFYLIRAVLRREKRENQFIQNLYQQEEDVHKADLESSMNFQKITGLTPSSAIQLEESKHNERTHLLEGNERTLLLEGAHSVPEYFNTIGIHNKPYTEDTQSEDWASPKM